MAILIIVLAFLMVYSALMESKADMEVEHKILHDDSWIDHPHFQRYLDRKR